MLRVQPEKQHHDIRTSFDGIRRDDNIELKLALAHVRGHCRRTSMPFPTAIWSNLQHQLNLSNTINGRLGSHWRGENPRERLEHRASYISIGKFSADSVNSPFRRGRQHPRQNLPSSNHNISRTSCVLEYMIDNEDAPSLDDGTCGDCAPVHPPLQEGLASLGASAMENTEATRNSDDACDFFVESCSISKQRLLPEV